MSAGLESLILFINGHLVLSLLIHNLKGEIKMNQSEIIEKIKSIYEKKTELDKEEEDSLIELLRKLNRKIKLSDWKFKIKLFLYKITRPFRKHDDYYILCSECEHEFTIPWKDKDLDFVCPKCGSKIIDKNKEI